MIQKVESDLWNEFKSELESIEEKRTRYIITLPSLEKHKDFWDKFLNEDFPSGNINKALEKNFALWILKNNIDVESIKIKYELNKWNIGGLLGWIKKASDGEILEYNTGEIINWAKENRPDLLEILIDKDKNLDLEKQKLEGIGIGNKLKFLNLEELKEFKESEDGEIIEKLIPSGSIGAWGGKRASYKSWLGLTCAVCISCGLDFIGFKTTKCSVGYLDRENGYPELKKRISMVEEGLGLKENIGEIYFLGDYFKLDTSEHLSQIEEFVKLKNIKIIFIDVYRRAVSFDENDANRVSEFFVDRIKPFCERTGVSIVFLHHEKKGESPDEMDNLRGSSDLVNYLDFVLLNVRRGNKIILKQLKSRRSKEIEPLEVKIETDEETFIRFSSSGTYLKITESDKCNKKILVWIVENNLKEITFTRFLSKAIGFGFSSTTSKRALTELQDRGIFQKKDFSKKAPYSIDLSAINLEDFNNVQN